MITLPVPELPPIDHQSEDPEPKATGYRPYAPLTATIYVIS